MKKRYRIYYRLGYIKYVPIENGNEGRRIFSLIGDLCYDDRAWIVNK